METLYGKLIFVHFLFAPKERAVKDYLLYTVRITPLYSPQGGKYFCI